MEFDFKQYFIGAFIIPLVVSSHAGFLAITEIFYYLKLYSKGQIKSETIVKGVFVLLILIFLTSMNVGRLLNGGIYLLTENESNQTHLSGTIDKIYILNRFEFPELSSEYKNGEMHGVCIVINGERYKCIAKGNLNEGDIVNMSYLPKSHYVLYIEKVVAGQSK